MIKKFVMTGIIVGLLSIPCFANSVSDKVIEEAALMETVDICFGGEKQEFIIKEITSKGISHKRAVQISDYIVNASELTGLDSLFITAVMEVESGFNSTNNDKALGLMNLPVAVAERNDAFEDKANIIQGAKLLAKYRNCLKKNEYVANRELIEKVLASYHSGLYVGERYDGKDNEVAIYVKAVLDTYDRFLLRTTEV